KNPISASSFDIAKMDKDSEVTSDYIDEETRSQFLKGVVYGKALSDGGWEINPKYLKKISEGEG
ncbi:hypothetical protein ACO1GV_10075, partial [Fusobacterium watanabei]